MARPWSVIARAVAAVAEDIESARDRDPALRSTFDTLLNSPGLHAIWSHRIAHAMWTSAAPLHLPARVLSTATRAVTGVEIHPAAQLGRRCFIDHGMGVVIGETAIVGDDVLLYHGATLGSRDARDGQRHPTIGNGVMIGAGARVLGPVHVGDGARVGANAVVVKDVPANSTAIGVAARIDAPAGSTPAADAPSSKRPAQSSRASSRPVRRPPVR